MKRCTLITGTTSGIGRGLMEHYDRQGWQVVAFNRRQDKLFESHFPRVQFRHCDVRDRETIRTYFREADGKNQLPELYYLNAGINKADNLDTFSLDTFREILDINLIGVLNFVDAALPYLNGKRATFVVTSSTSNILPNPHHVGYFISKFAEEKVFRLFNEQYQRKGWEFKVLILGPARTNIPIGKLHSKLQTWVLNAILATVEETIPHIVRFAHSRRKILYWPKTAVSLSFLVAFLKKIIPGFYKGSVPQT